MKYLEITIQKERLKVSINQNHPTTGDRLVMDADIRLEELIASGKLKGGELIKINGRTSLPVAYTILHKIAHLYSAIAVNDPRLGYVVVVSTNPKYQLGDILDRNERITPGLDNNPEETSFLINLQDNTLKIGFNPKVNTTGDRLVRDAATGLNELVASGRLKGKLLKIEGRASLLVSYVIASKVLHAYGAIAVFEPKDGDRGLDRYIVTISHSPDYRVGDTFEEKSPSQTSIKIALCGSPNTGKTVLRDGLKKAIRDNLDAPAEWLYVISGCPDGDYNWMTEIEPELARELKAQYKAQFTPEFALEKAREIRSIKNPLLLFDVGGKITPENEQIVAGATHAIIIVPTGGIATKLKGLWQQYRWWNFCQKLDLKIIAIIYSDYWGKEDRVYRDRHGHLTGARQPRPPCPPLFKGLVHHLERGKDSSSRITIQALARSIVALYTNN
jgi:CRISPR-associated protein Csx3